MSKHRYKKGQLVQHVPSGCVLSVKHNYTHGETLSVDIPANNHSFTYWPVSDCRPAPDANLAAAATDMYEALDSLMKKECYDYGATDGKACLLCLQPDGPCKCGLALVKARGDK